MAIDFAASYRLIGQTLGNSELISASIGTVIDFCEAGTPHPDWSKFRGLPYDDGAGMHDWLQSRLRERAPSVTLRGLWFGLFNPVYDGKPSADIYISGSTSFDPDDSTGDWATSPAWWPEEQCGSSVLATIYRIAHHDGGLRNDAEYPLVLAYGTFLIRRLLHEVEPALVLGASEALGAAVGFDSGDFILLGELSGAGLKPLTRP